MLRAPNIGGHRKLFCRRAMLPFGSHQAPLYRGSRQKRKWYIPSRRSSGYEARVDQNLWSKSREWSPSVVVFKELRRRIRNLKSLQASLEVPRTLLSRNQGDVVDSLRAVVPLPLSFITSAISRVWFHPSPGNRAAGRENRCHGILQCCNSLI